MRAVQYIAQLGGQEPGGEFNGTSEREVRIAQQGDANLRTQRPFRVVAHGFYEGGHDTSLQRSHNRILGEARAFERSLPDARFLIEQQSTGNSFGAAPGQGNALSQSNPR